MARWTILLLGAGLGVNALAMLTGPFAWYNAVPGVMATGAYNPHFVRDIGMAYLVAAAGMIWWVRRPGHGWPALVCSAGFLSLHAAIHLVDASCGRNLLADLVRDFPGVFLPALIVVGVAISHQPRKDPQNA